MSVLAVNRLCRDVLHDRAFRERIKADPAAAITGRDLTAEERGPSSPATLPSSTAWASTRS